MTDTTSKSKFFCVLGMHRSATSLIAGGLDAQDVNMGDNLLGANASNPKGHFEDVDFLQLNQKILEKAGGDWKNPPERQEILDVGLDEQIRQTVEEHKDDLWGFKDPRTTLTIEKYLPYLDNPHFVTIFREPSEVGKSLERRGDMSKEEGKQLAKVYNNRLLDFLEDWHDSCYNTPTSE